MSKTHARLLAAELQYKFAVCVAKSRIDAKETISGSLMTFTWGGHTLGQDELLLTPDQEAASSTLLEHTATFLLMQQLDAAFEDQYGAARFDLLDEELVTACWIARLIRNSFAHDPIAPTWLIDRRVGGTRLAFRDILTLDTASLQGRRVQRQDFGGPIALLRFLQACRGDYFKGAAA